MQPLFISTPLVESVKMGKSFQGQIYLKLETLQPTGSFKCRGIGTLCLHYTQNEKSKGFVSSSGGNASLAVAYAGQILDKPVEIIVPQTTLPFMIEKMQRLNAKVCVQGADWNAADAKARLLAKQLGWHYIPPFDHPIIWKGHSTIIHEIKDTGLKPDAIVVAVGGGGLLCGLIEGLRTVGWSDIPVFTAETEGAASLAASIKNGQLVTLDSIDTIATSLGAKQVANQAWIDAKIHPIISKTVTDCQALQAVIRFFDDHNILVEPACGAALALVYEKIVDPNLYQNIVVIVCGGKGVNLNLLEKWSEKLGLNNASID
jgi:L-serine/L-threonine ammonia-lyase